MARSNEPLVWLPFFAGAGLSALFLPVLILLTSVGVAGGWITAERLWAVLQLWLVRLVLFVLISLSLFHAVHRFRFILIDLGLKGARTPVAVLCYGAAVVGTILAAVFALRLA